MRDERGFTLLEVLVAFVIAALALGVLFQGALGGVESARVSGRYEEALSRARSRLAAVGHGTRLAAGQQQGEDGGGYRWRMRIAPSAVAPVARGSAADIARGPHVQLYAVSVAVSWEQGGVTREVRLDTARIGPAPPPTP